VQRMIGLEVGDAERTSLAVEFVGAALLILRFAEIRQHVVIRPPGVAELALQGGIYSARQIDKRLKGQSGVGAPFKYRDLGTAAYISRFNAVVEIGPFKFWGWPGWWRGCRGPS